MVNVMLIAVDKQLWVFLQWTFTETILSEWMTVTSIGLNGDWDAIDLEKLTPNVDYEVRAVVREKDNQTILDDVLVFKFITPSCTPRGKFDANFILSW
jgi:hypothetical protein